MRLIRRLIVNGLEVLADEGYQREVWVYDSRPGVRSDFYEVVSTLFDFGKVDEILSVRLAESGLTFDEREKLRPAIDLLNAIDRAYTYPAPDEEILKDARWPQLRELSATAAAALRANWNEAKDGKPNDLQGRFDAADAYINPNNRKGPPA